MKIDIEKLYNLLNMSLFANSPILSGNMQSGIIIDDVQDNEVTICINAPFYDLKEFNKNNRIVFTGRNYNGITDYAMWVNDKGAFGKHNKSEHWVNRVCNDVVQVIAGEIGAEVINELPLD